MSSMKSRRKARPVASLVLPRPGSMVARWRTDTITPVADGTPVGSWTDMISGRELAAAGAVRPTYLNNGGWGGRPCLAFNGTQSLSGPTPEAIAAIATGEYTIFVVYGNAQTTPFGTIIAATTGAGINIVCSGSQTCLPTPDHMNYSGAGFSTSALTVTKTSPVNSGNLVSMAINGAIYGTKTSTLAGTLNQISVGGFSNNASGFKGNILEAIIWQGKLTQTDLFQVERVIRDYYSQPYPWATVGYVYCAQGNSQTLTSPYFINTNWPRQLAVNLGIPIGGQCNFGWYGQTMAGDLKIARAENLTGISLVTGVPTKHSIFEFANETGNVTTPISSSVALSDATNMLNFLKQNPLDKVAFATGMGSGLAGIDAKLNNWGAYWDVAANRTGLMDAYVALHLDSHLGAGTVNSSAPYGINWNNNNGKTTFTASVSTSTGKLTLTSAIATPLAGATIIGPGLTVSPAVPASLGTLVSGTAGAIGAVYNLAGSAVLSSSSGSYTHNIGDGTHPSDYGYTFMPGIFAVVGTM